MREGTLDAVKGVERVVSVKALKAKIRELERTLGKKTMKVEILKEAIEIAQGKKLLLRKPIYREDDSQSKLSRMLWKSPDLTV